MAQDYEKVVQHNAALWDVLSLLAGGTLDDPQAYATEALQRLKDPALQGWIPLADRKPQPAVRAGGDTFVMVLVTTTTGFVAEAMYSSVDGWHMLGVPVTEAIIRYWKPWPASPTLP